MVLSNYFNIQFNDLTRPNTLIGLMKVPVLIEQL